MCDDEQLFCQVATRVGSMDDIIFHHWWLTAMDRWALYHHNIVIFKKPCSRQKTNHSSVSAIPYKNVFIIYLILILGDFLGHQAEAQNNLHLTWRGITFRVHDSFVWTKGDFVDLNFNIIVCLSLKKMTKFNRLCIYSGYNQFFPQQGLTTTDHFFSYCHC